ncbi:MAG: hypothetical protein HOF01_03565 [Chloroflexi bacterium]|nr:hypothetical protein [Chloroflexota bacterium]
MSGSDVADMEDVLAGRDPSTGLKMMLNEVLRESSEVPEIPGSRSHHLGHPVAGRNVKAGTL